MPLIIQLYSFYGLTEILQRPQQNIGQKNDLFLSLLNSKLGQRIIKVLICI